MPDKENKPVEKPTQQPTENNTENTRKPLRTKPATHERIIKGNGDEKKLR